MAKDKLVTIPIEGWKRDRLNQYCQDKGTKVSELITAYIDKCLAGIIDVEPLVDRPTDESYQTLSDLYLSIEEFANTNIATILERLDEVESSTISTDAIVDRAVERIIQCGAIDKAVENLIQLPDPNDLQRLPDSEMGDYESLRRMYDELTDSTNSNMDLLLNQMKVLEGRLSHAIEPSIDKPLALPQQPITDGSQTYTHAQLARLTGKNSATISRWATGQRRTPDDFAAAWTFKDGKWSQT